MDYVKANSILMRMGGKTCEVSFLLNKNVCTRSELEQMVEEGYLVYTDNKTHVMKTEKGKKLW